MLSGLLDRFNRNQFSRPMDRCVVSCLVARPWPPLAPYNAWHIRAGNVGHAIRYVYAGRKKIAATQSTTRRAFRVTSLRRGWARNRQGFMLTLLRSQHGGHKLHQLFKFLNAHVFLNDNFRHGCAKRYQTRTF